MKWLKRWWMQASGLQAIIEESQRSRDALFADANRLGKLMQQVQSAAWSLNRDYKAVDEVKRRVVMIGANVDDIQTSLRDTKALFDARREIRSELAALRREVEKLTKENT